MEEFPGDLVVKDLVLSLLWHRFHPWHQELFHAQGVPPKKNNHQWMLNLVEFLFLFLLHPLHMEVPGDRD